MKKLTLLLIMLIPVMVFSQSYTGDDFKARNYVRAPLYRTATDTIYRLGGLKADSIYLKGEGLWYKSFASQWTTSGSDIYYNDGNVGIGTNNPVYKLDVNGLIGGSNIETNTTSLSTKLGVEAGLNENETAARYNVVIGNVAARNITTGSQNVIIGNEAGKINNGNNNLMVGSSSGFAANCSNGSFFGFQSGYNTTGGNNTFIGTNSGFTNTSGQNNICLGFSAGYFETGSNKLFIDNQARTDEATSRTNSLIYGVFDATPANQSLTINAKLKVDMPHIAVYRNTDLTISATQNIWYKITGFTSKDADMMTVAGDSIQLTVAGHYIVNINTSFSGLNNEVWELAIFKNNTLEEPSQLRYTSTADVGNMSCPVYVSSDGDDWISFRIRNTTDGDDPTIKRFSAIISTIHLSK